MPNKLQRAERRPVVKHADAIGHAARPFTYPGRRQGIMTVQKKIVRPQPRQVPCDQFRPVQLLAASSRAAESVRLMSQRRQCSTCAMNSCMTKCQRRNGGYTCSVIQSTLPSRILGSACVTVRSDLTTSGSTGCTPVSQANCDACVLSEASITTLIEGRNYNAHFDLSCSVGGRSFGRLASGAVSSDSAFSAAVARQVRGGERS